MTVTKRQTLLSLFIALSKLSSIRDATEISESCKIKVMNATVLYFKRELKKKQREKRYSIIQL